VIDTGTARISRYSPRSKMQRLPIEAISQASANQRAGRCGRIAPGVCIRLFDEQDFATREKFTPPEIVRTNLASVILQTASLNLGRLEDFPLLEPPKPTAIRDGYKTLFELGAVDERDQLTELGRQLARLPVDPRIARIIVAGHSEGCLNDILIIAAALEAQDPRDRPLDQQQAADEKHKQFQHPDSDFLGYLKLWDFYHHLKDTLTKSQVRKACLQNFLNFNRLREWADLHRQLVELVEENGMKVGKRRWLEATPKDSLSPGERLAEGRVRAESPSDLRRRGKRLTQMEKERPLSCGSLTPVLSQREREMRDSSAAIHRALLAGFLASIANRESESAEYSAAGGLKANVWPGSGTFGSKPKWIVAAELVETTKRYLRTVARIDPAWIEPLAEHLVTKTHSEPHWDRSAGSAMAFERVSLFGLTIVPRRRVRLGRIDPATARRLLIQHGLVERDWDCTAPFFVHNARLLDELEALRVKSRRADFLKGEETLFEFYDERIPADVVDGASLLKWCKACSSGFRRPPPPEGGTTNSLFLAREDLLNPERATATAEEFPSQLQLKHFSVPLEYRLEPGAADDGITISVPQEGLNQLDPQRIGWLVPGLLEEKIVALIKSLPKELRRLFVPVPETAKAVLKQLEFGTGELLVKVAAVLSKLGGQRIDPGAFREADLPPHLRINIKVVGADGQVVSSGRDLDQLRSQLGAKASQSFSAIDHSQWNRDGLTDWDFEVLPPSVELEHGGLKLRGFPSLVDRGDAVSLRLADTAERAAFDTHFGLRRLFVIAASKELKKQVQHLPELGKWTLLSATLPDKGKLPQALAELIAERALFGRRGTPACPVSRPSTTEAGQSASLPPRTKSQFQELVRAAKLQIPAAVQEVMPLVGSLLAAYTEARRAVEGCHPQFAQTAVVDCREQLAQLTEAGFLTTTSWDWLQQFPRYFQAIALRIKKLAAGGQQRDQRAMADIEPRWRKLLARLESDRQQRRVDLNVLTCRWMLEELRVSLFAQELRTAVPISPQRWDKQWELVMRTR
jgi:ATP-dependent helicase HrpA